MKVLPNSLIYSIIILLTAVTRSSATGSIGPRAFVGAFNTFAKRAPIAAAFVASSVNGIGADFIAQKAESLKRSRSTVRDVSPALEIQGGSGNNTLSLEPFAVQEPSSPGLLNLFSGIDYRRSLAFFLYGGCYQGASLCFIYNNLFNTLFGPENAILKTLVSQLIMAPCLTLPVAYLFKGWVYGQTFQEALDSYWIGLTQKGLLLSFWKLWVPIQLLVFTVIPGHLRMPFSSFFSFVWTVVLSRISNSS